MNPIGPIGLAGGISAGFTKEEREEHGLNPTVLCCMIADFEEGMADLVKKHKSVRIIDFGIFYQRAYLASPKYINRERMSINFRPIPWNLLIKENDDEEEDL